MERSRVMWRWWCSHLQLLCKVKLGNIEGSIHPSSFSRRNIICCLRWNSDFAHKSRYYVREHSHLQLQVLWTHGSSLHQPPWNLCSSCLIVITFIYRLAALTLHVLARMPNITMVQDMEQEMWALRNAVNWHINGTIQICAVGQRLSLSSPTCLLDMHKFKCPN